MRPTPNDLSFHLFGFPIAIQPFFWLIAALLAAVYIGRIDNMPIWIAQMLAGMAGVLLSILVHELGHALTFRYVFRTPCAIVLHGFGGMAIPLQHYARGHGFRGMVANCFLSFSGPFAGFVLAFLLSMFLVLTLAMFPSVIEIQGDEPPTLFLFFLNWTITISIFWGILNLLPIYPMDGGQIAREIFIYFFPRRGVEYSLALSMMLAVLLAIAAFMLLGMFIIAIFFGFFAYQNYQELTGRSFWR